MLWWKICWVVICIQMTFHYEEKENFAAHWRELHIFMFFFSCTPCSDVCEARLAGDDADACRTPTEGPMSRRTGGPMSRRTDGHHRALLGCGRGTKKRTRKSDSWLDGMSARPTRLQNNIKILCFANWCALTRTMDAFGNGNISVRCGAVQQWRSVWWEYSTYCGPVVFSNCQDWGPTLHARLITAGCRTLFAG